MTLPPASPPPPAPGSPDPGGLMRSIGHLVRGLSALFWGLPIALVVSVQTARTGLFSSLGVVPPLLANALLLYALLQVGHFQSRERVWRQALDRTKFVGLVNLGLSPFLYWWKMMPHVLHYQFAVLLLALSGLIFVFNLNQALQRLAAMLPDETLRIEAKLFTTLNLGLLLATLGLIAVWVGASQWKPPLSVVTPFLALAERAGLLVLLLLILLPVALTMALLWKIKETLLGSVFAQKS